MDVTDGQTGFYSDKKEVKNMHITDPIADMLTRIRNANDARHTTVDIPASKMKKAIADILFERRLCQER